MRKSAVIVFDMDDTLYPEMQYAESGLRAVGEELEEQYGLPGIATHLQNALHSGVRGTLFNDAVSHFELPESIIPTLVERYRNHTPAIQLYADAVALLHRLEGRVNLALITDGPLISQEKKIEALALRPRFDLVVCTDQWGSEFWKPHERPYLHVMQHFEVQPERACYIGDNPTKDFISARRLGWKTIRVNRPRRLNPSEPPSADHEAEFLIPSLERAWLHIRQLVVE